MIHKSHPQDASQPATGERCEICGKAGGENFGGRIVCGECAQEMGSCCPEFGKDDLWDL